MPTTAENADDKKVKDTEALFQYWIEEISGALKREKRWRKKAREAVSLYEAEREEENAYNILYANTETLAPALYNSVPRPDVKRRYNDDDPLGLLGSRVIERSLIYILDSDLNEQSSFDSGMQSAVLEALVPGRGQMRVKYDAKLAQKQAPGVAEPDEGEPREGLEGESSTYEAVEEECVFIEEVPWDKFLHGYAKKWKDVPWVAFEHTMTKEEVEDNFGEEYAKALEFGEGSGMDSDEDDSDDEARKDRESTASKFACVYEIWDKRNKKIIFISPNCRGRVPKEVEDPLNLSGFFPCPEPVRLIKRVSSLTPITLYTQYANQAKELNRISVRINKLVMALKVRGFYDSTVQGLEQLLESDDNVLLPAENCAAFQQGQTLEKSIYLMPIEKLINVLQQLYVQRQQVKTVIYEITGIADIMRGSSMASETLGAQNIKDRWGTLRLKKGQREVQRFARDMLRLLGELAITKLSPETLGKMTDLKIPTGAQKQQAVELLQNIQSQPMPAQVPGQPPASPPEIPPEITAAANSPSWDDVLALLQDDIQRSYRIDIETNSTVDVEATEDKQNVGELLNALAQFFNGVGPMVQNGTLPFDAAKAILMGIVRKFRFGSDIEDELKTMKQPPAPVDPKAEAAKVAGPSPEELQAKQAQARYDMQLAELDYQLKSAEHALRMKELRLKGELAEAKYVQQMRQLAMPKPAPKSTGVTRP